jgi:hypothetical protein
MTKKGDTPYWTKGKLSQVFSFQPDIITIKLGTNDTKPKNWDSLGYGTQFKKDYLAMIDTLAAMASHPKIILVIPVPIFPNATGAAWGIRDSALQKEIPIIQDIAAERGLPLIDANTPLKNFPEFFSADGVHPSAAGEDTIAHIMYRALIATPVFGRDCLRDRPAKLNGSGGIDVSAYTPKADVFDIAGKLLYRCSVSDAVRGLPLASNRGNGVRFVRAAAECPVRVRLERLK